MKPKIKILNKGMHPIELKCPFVYLLTGPKQGILYTGGRGWYRMCSRQATVGLVVLKIKHNIYSAQTATF
jgi:hypothetical protein